MISYIGGKSRMAKWICEYIPEDITTYVEVFGGAFWVYIKGDIHTKPKLKQVIYNDKNRFMTNLFKCFTYPEEFYEILGEAKSQNEELFYMCQDNLNVIAKGNCNFKIGNSDIGSQYAYVATQVFSGSKVLESKFIDLKGKYGSKYDALRRRLKKKDVIERLERISKCENLSYEDILKKYDNPKTFFYVDPPYWKTENYYSNHDFDRDDHELLCSMLKKIDGKFALSYYDFPLLSEWLPKDKYTWVEKEFSKAAGAQKGKKQNKGTELLIMNY
tara:strand:+ start:707 stop:1525 length:819 start_codon:yes stop_codon:yes gene_type:complete